MNQPQPNNPLQEITNQLASGSHRTRLTLEQGDIHGTAEKTWRLIPTAMIVETKAGAPTGGTPGQMVLDTTNNRIYFNVLGTWKYAALI